MARRSRTLTAEQRTALRTQVVTPWLLARAARAEREAEQYAAAPRESRLAILRKQEQARHGEHLDALRRWCQRDIARELDLMTDVRTPIVLLPARVETRFVREDPHNRLVLKIRVYPDEIGIESDDPWLQPDEAEAADRYLEMVGPSRDAEVSAWTWIAERLGPARAARVVATPVEQRKVRARKGFPAPAEARCLPDRWVAFGYQKDSSGTLVERFRVAGEPIPDPLPVQPEWKEPDASNEDNLPLDDQTRWLVDFERACEVGMGLRVSAASSPDRDFDLSRGLDLLVVVGVKTWATPDLGSGLLTELFQSHRYDRGVALVRQGTPTNNTGVESSGWTEAGEARGLRYDQERALEVTPPTDSDGTRLLAALGLSRAALADLAHRGWTDEETAARRVQEALWPATLGYTLRKLYNLAPALRGDIHEFYTGYVRAGGPLPAFRVGDSPYGVLPVSSQQRWAPDEVANVVLKELRASWTDWSAQVPRVSPTSAEADLERVLKRSPGAQGVLAREMWLDLKPDLVHHAWMPWLGPALGEGYSDEEALDRVDRLAQAKVLRASAREGGDQTLRVGFPEGASASDLARDLKTLASYIRATSDSAPSSAEMAERYGLPGLLLLHTAGMARHLYESFPSEQGDLYLRPQGEGAGRAHAWECADALDQMASLLEPPGADAPSLELETLARLVYDTLDLCSHRLDAWITGLYSRRLKECRDKRSNSYIGGYAWVHDLRPEDASNPAEQSLGYVHAPSLGQAATAAVLRNGYLSADTDAEGTEQQFAVELSSGRVRDARLLIQGLRQGQSLSALLGYRLERALHEERLEVYIATLRARFPIANTGTRADDETGAGLAPRDVADGHALLREWLSKGKALLLDVAPRDDEAREGLRRVFDGLAETLDAFNDLLLAESVHQAVQGNLPAAKAALDGMAGTAVPPDPDVIRSPRGGVALVQRFAIVFDETPEPDVGLPGGWPKGSRYEAAPGLAIWLARVLGVASRYTARAWVNDGSARHDCWLNAASLGLGPLDLLAMLASGHEAAGGRAFDEACREVARRELPLGEIRLALGEAYTPDNLSFQDLADLLRSVGALLSCCRPLEAADLLAPAQAGSTSASTARSTEGIVKQLDHLGPESDPESVPPPIILPFPLPSPLPAAPEGPPSQGELVSMLQAQAEVREGVGRWVELRALAEALGAAPVSLHALQQAPGAEGEAAWVGRSVPPINSLSLVLEGTLPSGGTCSGLLVETWTETVPTAGAGEDRTTTGLVFHYDDAGAEAPQAVLIAVAPDLGKPCWAMDTLVDIVRETYELARIRGVTLEEMQEEWPFLPAAIAPGLPYSSATTTWRSGPALPVGLLWEEESNDAGGSR